jgi:hypothetical protein
VQLGCPPKLVSYRNNRNWNRNSFRHYPKQDVCFGCFALISKQGVSVFRNNQNKQKINRNSSKFVKISTFLIPHTISSVCFGCLDTGPKHRNKAQKFFFGFAKKQTEKQPKQIELRFVSIRTEKKINGFEDILIENVFLRFFWFVWKKFCLFRLFRYRSETPKQTGENQKNAFWFHETNQRTTGTD